VGFKKPIWKLKGSEYGGDYQSFPLLFNFWWCYPTSSEGELMHKTDFLVIGGGIAGLTFALEAAQHGQVTVLFKRAPKESATAWAQGGIAAVSSPDDTFDSHRDDTLQAGADLCNTKIVELVVREGPSRIEELIARGAHFDQVEGTKDFHLHKEGGHSRRRILHHADSTGYEIQQALLASARQNPNISFHENTFAIDLITTHKAGVQTEKPVRVLGAYVLFEDDTIQPVLAQKVLVATGGAGKVYLYTSNPDVSTGDGIAMCFRAGARVGNLEFFQFHPTCLYHPKAKSFLLSEALRGEGAVLRRMNGERFMDRHHELAELAPRDVVARAIDFEMKLHGEDYVLLDITSQKPEFVREHFPTLCERCAEFGYDLATEPVPVVPAAHYCCGGVVSDEDGCTDIEDLYVAGECAHTGLHGANRLASNSLLEGVVFGYRAAKHAINSLDRTRAIPDVPAWDSGTAVDSDEQVVIAQNWDEIRRFMWNYVGIVRSDKRLARALRRCDLIEKEINEYYWNFLVTTDLLELRNLNLVARLVIQSAIARKESRGLHYTIDYPEKQSVKQDTIIAPELSTTP
jgi:L-aspartate oxidase